MVARPMTVNGKTVILLILAVALGSAALSWWNQYRRGQRVLELWGADVAYRIRLAPETELLALATSGGTSGDGAAASPAPPADAGLTVGSRVIPVQQRRSLTGSPGLVHARQALIQDSSYEWDAPTPTDEIAWRYAVQFRDPRDSQATSLLLFDPESGWIKETQRGTGARLVPLIRQGLDRLFRERLQSPGATPAAPTTPAPSAAR